MHLPICLFFIVIEKSAKEIHIEQKTSISDCDRRIETARVKTRVEERRIFFFLACYECSLLCPFYVFALIHFNLLCRSFSFCYFKCCFNTHLSQTMYSSSVLFSSCQCLSLSLSVMFGFILYPCLSSSRFLSNFLSGPAVEIYSRLIIKEPL